MQSITDDSNCLKAKLEKSERIVGKGQRKERYKLPLVQRTSKTGLHDISNLHTFRASYLLGLLQMERFLFVSLHFLED